MKMVDTQTLVHRAEFASRRAARKFVKALKEEKTQSAIALTGVAAAPFIALKTDAGIVAHNLAGHIDRAIAPLETAAAAAKEGRIDDAINAYLSHLTTTVTEHAAAADIAPILVKGSGTRDGGGDALAAMARIMGLN